MEVTRNNICAGQLDLVGDAENISKGPTYCLNGVYRVHLQWRKEKDLVRRADLGN